MPSTERALLVGPSPKSLLVSCRLGILESAFISWSFSDQTSLDVAGSTIVGGGREGCAHRKVVRASISS